MEIGEKYTSNGIIYTIISDDSVEVTKCREGSHVVIPDTIDIDDVTYCVKSIGMMAFFGKRDVVSVTIPGCVEEIGEAAFSCCENLTSVNIPEGVETIVYETFYGCESLKELYIPDSVRCVEERALWYCRSLETISIPKHLLGIEYPKILPKRASDGGQCRGMDHLQHCYVRLPSGEIDEYDVE
jgi:hypothetical protein